ncbi:MAG: hypothetical protein IT246_08965 [Bacteroidia bacterium]|nr:hypothetical protein [Bacteroidia bacterium]
MNVLKLFSFIAAITLFISCKKENTIIPNDTDGLISAKSISNATHNIIFYTQNGKFQQGYNKIFFQIKNLDGSLVTNATANWKPLMHMTSMQHACPYSSISKSANSNSLYEGFIVFQMAGNSTEYWDLTIEYTIDNTTYTATERIDVEAVTKKNVLSFKGSDNVSYVLAMVAPSNPKVATNDMEAMLFKKETMMSYPVVNNYTIKIDPRMTSMGNHGSPNNVDLKQTSLNGSYFGKLSLTMTGYWKINLQLENESGTILKGEPVTETQESSSIFFEIEF